MITQISAATLQTAPRIPAMGPSVKTKMEAEHTLRHPVLQDMAVPTAGDSIFYTLLLEYQLILRMCLGQITMS